MKICSIKADTAVLDYGESLEKLTIVTDGELPAEGVRELAVTGAFHDTTGKTAVKAEELTAHAEGGELVIGTAPFPYRYDFHITFAAGGQRCDITKEDVTERVVKDLDTFSAREDGNVKYRLYTPEAESARPLILFLHGGGECGCDNEAQMTGTLGALQLAMRYSDMYVLAPQAPAPGHMSMEEAFAIFAQRGDPLRNHMGDTPFCLKGERGWNRDYLSKVCAVIRRMIGEGRVDPGRVYIIGLSMGGGGTITACSVDPDLFAAAVPICPSMNGEVYSILRSFPELPVWIGTAYMDHQLPRHSYILDACEKLWIEGRKDVKYSIFTPDELAKYGLGVDPTLTVAELAEENHCSWIPVLHNERGMLDWMVSHVKS